MPSRAFADLIAIGRVIKPQGRHGEVVVAPLSDRPDRFPELRSVFVEAAGGGVRAVVVKSCWPHKDRFVLKLEGVDTIDDAERYRGLELRIGEEELEELPPGSFYHHQLRGLVVLDETGVEVGTVAEILETGGEAPVLTVRGAGGETLIPLAEEFVKQVDLPARRLRVRLPQYVEAKPARPLAERAR